jgi:hypothetical protein
MLHIYGDRLRRDDLAFFVVADVRRPAALSGLMIAQMAAARP